jgi:hypothetical protein
MRRVNLIGNNINRVTSTLARGCPPCVVMKRPINKGFKHRVQGVHLFRGLFIIFFFFFVYSLGIRIYICVIVKAAFISRFYIKKLKRVDRVDRVDKVDIARNIKGLGNSTGWTSFGQGGRDLIFHSQCLNKSAYWMVMR